jgi:hypothetical protein
MVGRAAPSMAEISWKFQFVQFASLFPAFEA